MKQQGLGRGEQAEQHYLVQPRALAGGGDLRHVSEFLRACGWRDTSTPGGSASMQSPDRAVRVSYDPWALPGGWTIHGRAKGPEGEWSAHLGRQAPVEIVAGLTDALARPRSAHAPNVWAPLKDWHTRFQGGHYMATSPDGSAWMQYRQEADGSRLWWTGARDEQGNGWTGTFTPNTPMHLVQAFAAELASTEPVMRPHGRVPLSRQIRAWSVSVLPSQLRAWQQARITAARAATQAPSDARSIRPRTRARPYTPADVARARR
ncbi:hypothetical protein SLNWT_7031 [Streptomyces albus]|uniref:DUF317 domain-containing protein n=1 Tax=Streptomyces albus (strain ATCC 21838 / DSM 41398 / FERM P-419 / JCM 4703 / NBRC 107858) TaxID=1081613 RepID=A0A0B5FAC1_STRA4|nr:hypothetical protein SLNWT_7031 [Streptomyces albus]AOU81710.1 hypothetical protein SLNHY_7019 [Streptomyces albus]